MRSSFLSAFFTLLLFAAAPAKAEWSPNSQEREIANDMAGSGQRRPELIYDPIIARVARERAQDMADHGYFDHVNRSGVAANYLLRQAGYQLPAWWGTDPKANYVESIAAGQSSASAAWSAWMNSPDHKKHLLALDPFYATETHYGIGYVADSKSKYRYYWVVITAPPQPNPALAITAPANGSALVDPVVNLAGTASAESGVQSVEVRVENAAGTGDFTPAIGTTSWQATMGNVAPGQNTIRVRSLDANGGVIAEVTRSVTYVATTNLTVGIVGGGTVTAGYAGTTRRTVGSVQTITATPATGYLFAGWTGGASAASRTISFAVADEMSIQAVFVVNVFPTVQGTYQGPIDSGSTQGLTQLSVTAAGAFSGKLLLKGASYSFSGNFNPLGVATLQIRPKKLSPITVSFALDTQNLGGEITGSVSDGTFTAAFTTVRAASFSKRQLSPLRGVYTARLNVVSSASEDRLPLGSGFATVNVESSGQVNITGRLVDDAAFSVGTMLSTADTAAIYIPLSGGSGAVVGTLTLTGTSTGMTGTLNWIQPSAGAAVKKFTLLAAGSPYRAPARRQAALQLPSCVLSFDGGNLADASFASPWLLLATVTTGNTIVVTGSNQQRIGLSINSANGVISGSMVHPFTKIVRPIRGITMQNENAAYGFFLGAGQSGSVSVTAP